MSTGCVCNNEPYRLSTPRPMVSTKSGANGSSWFTRPRPDLVNTIRAYIRKPEKSKRYAYVHAWVAHISKREADSIAESVFWATRTMFTDSDEASHNGSS